MTDTAEKEQKPIPPKYTMEFQWQEYLKRMGMRESAMPPDQIRETKRAFMGAMGQMLVLLRDEIAGESDEDGVSFIEAMWQETARYWISQNQQDN